MTTLHFIDAVRDDEETDTKTRFRIFFRHNKSVSETFHEPGEDAWVDFHFAVNMSIDPDGKVPHRRPHVIGDDLVWCYDYLHKHWETFDEEDCEVVDLVAVRS